MLHFNRVWLYFTSCNLSIGAARSTLALLDFKAESRKKNKRSENVPDQQTRLH